MQFANVYIVEILVVKGFFNLVLDRNYILTGWALKIYTIFGTLRLLSRKKKATCYGK